MTTFHERPDDEKCIDEMWLVLTEQRERLSAQEREIELLKRRSPDRPLDPTPSVQAIATRTRTLSRSALLKVAIGGAIGVASVATIDSTSAFANCTFSPLLEDSYQAHPSCFGLFSAYQTNDDPAGVHYQYGVNVQGTSCGVYGESLVTPRTGSSRTGTNLTGVYGIGDHGGVVGETSGSSYDAVRGNHTGTGHGVHGLTGAGVPYGGVFGENTGSGYGVRGLGANNSGVFGASTGVNGVEGQTEAAGASGVYGENHANGFGLYGRSKSGTITLGSGVGVTGESGTGTGVHGIGSLAVSGTSTDDFGVGVAGTAPSNQNSQSIGITGSGDYGVQGTGNYGVVGYTATGVTAGGFAVYGRAAQSCIGVGGIADKGDGVAGQSNTGNGVSGTSGNSGTPGLGYGGRFRVNAGGLAPLLLEAAGSTGHPVTGSGNHRVGEFWVDSTGTLFLCTLAGNPGTWRQVSFVGGPTDARVTTFSANRSGDAVTLQWHMADTKSITGFDVFAGSHRLTRATIRPHRSRNYQYHTRWHGGDIFRLHVLMHNGEVIIVAAG